MDSERREIQENEIILLISKYLSVRVSLECSWIGKRLYQNRKGVSERKRIARYWLWRSRGMKWTPPKMHYVKDLKTILNEYIQLKSKSLAQEELSHTVSLSMGPEIEKTFKHLEVNSNALCDVGSPIRLRCVSSNDWESSGKDQRELRTGPAVCSAGTPTHRLAGQCSGWSLSFRLGVYQWTWPAHGAVSSTVPNTPRASAMWFLTSRAFYQTSSTTRSTRTKS